jgi:hypothetical protein
MEKERHLVAERDNDPQKEQVKRFEVSAENGPVFTKENAEHLAQVLGGNLEVQANSHSDFLGQIETANFVLEVQTHGPQGSENARNASMAYKEIPPHAEEPHRTIVLMGIRRIEQDKQYPDRLWFYQGQSRLDKQGQPLVAMRIDSKGSVLVRSSFEE